MDADFSLMDRKVVDAINNTQKLSRFIRGLRAWVGFKQIGVPYKRSERLLELSTNNFLKILTGQKKESSHFHIFL